MVVVIHVKPMALILGIAVCRPSRVRGAANKRLCRWHTIGSVKHFFSPLYLVIKPAPLVVKRPPAVATIGTL